MTTYLEREAELIRRCLPEGIAVAEDSDVLFLRYAVLLRAKGAEAQASEVRDAWSSWMFRVDPGHESIRPFGELDAEPRGEDGLFLVAISAAAARR